MGQEVWHMPTIFSLSILRESCEDLPVESSR